MAHCWHQPRIHQRAGGAMKALLKSIAYALGGGCALFVVLSVWLTVDAIAHLDDFPAKPQCIPAPQSICASTGDVGVRL